MAVKASAHITLNSVVDIQATYRYYQLKSSTATKPSAPTAFPPPSAWTDSEPTYTSGSTNSLYFVDCTVFSDGGFKYSAVSMSTSYEAAKEAYNKAQNAQDTADDAKSSAETAYNKVNSRGEQLIVNGSCLMGDNTNFSQWTYDGSVSHNSAGSFTMPEGVRGNGVETDEFFPISANNEYTFSFDVKSKNGLAQMYSMLIFYDVDKLKITANNSIYLAGSTTTLARDLKTGDTVIYLTDTSGWDTTRNNHYYLAIWNYTNSFGYTYPAGTYTRNRITLPKTSDYKLDGDYLDKTANTLTLTTAYSGATIPAGTEVSQGGAGSTYKYFPVSGRIIEAEWTSYSGKISGIDYSGGNKGGMFPPGAAYAKVGFLWNYNLAADQLWATNISVTDTTAVSAAQTAADDAQNAADSAQELADTNANRIASLEIANGEINIKIEQSNDELSGKLDSIQGNVTTLTTEVNNKASAAYVDEAVQNGLENGTVKNLETSNGDVEYRFGADGMHITDTANDFESIVDEKGMRVFKGDDVKLSATEAGVEAKDLKATTYLIIANKCRFEEYDGRMGCFWIG